MRRTGRLEKTIYRVAVHSRRPGPYLQRQVQDYCEDLRNHLVQDALDDHHAYTNIVVSDYHPCKKKFIRPLKVAGSDIA